MPSEFTIACYYFPNYHIDPRNEAQHGPGWTEWELVKRAEPSFEGHRQPKVPLWGYGDESDPAVMAKKIEAASIHGIDAFIFDWYYYDDGPFLERGLEKGFLGAPNNDKMKFAVMWANHDWHDIHPMKLNCPPRLEHRGFVSRETFEKVTDHVIERYFSHPSYWLIDERPYFSYYELFTLVDGLGGPQAARDALLSFRRKTQAAGFPDLHLNAVLWGLRAMDNDKELQGRSEMASYFGVDSITSYVWAHHVPMNDFPLVSYQEMMDGATRQWSEFEKEFPVPYYPNVSMGWDSSPRTVQSDTFINAGYPFCPSTSGNTPEAFKEALRRARNFLAPRPQHERVLTINAWNEWTEGSYLEPDTVNCLGYLEAVREVFGG